MSDEPKYKLWSIRRQKEKDGPIFPLRIEFPEPQTKNEVTCYCLIKTLTKDPDFFDFRYINTEPVFNNPRTPSRKE